MMDIDTRTLTRNQERLIHLAHSYAAADMALPIDLTAALLQEGLSPDPFNQTDIEDYINGY